jgi:hypothetical protein
MGRLQNLKLLYEMHSVLLSYLLFRGKPLNFSISL